MKKSIIIISFIFGLVIGLGVGWFVFRNNHKSHSDSHGENGHISHHEANHEGSLNAIEECEIGHIEVKVEDDMLRCWFVGGGNDTDKSLRIPDNSISLLARLDRGDTKELMLRAKPLDLAGEKIGDCSYFEAKAEWLKGIKEFEATGKATVKGKNRKLKIRYPKGYDPDDEHDHNDEHGHQD